MTQSSLSALGIAFLLSSPLLAQTAPSPAQPGSYQLEVNSQAVVLDVLVTDKQGRPSTALTRDDFTIKEDGVVQTILSFESASQRAPVPEVHNTAELEHAAPDATVAIVVLDEMTGTQADEVYTRRDTKMFLEAATPTMPTPTMLIAVDMNGISVLADFTTSREALLAALERHKPRHDARIDSLSGFGQNPNWKDQMYNSSLYALQGIAQATSGHRGHKNIFWIGKGAPDLVRTDFVTPIDKVDAMLEATTNALRDARVTLYSLDPASMTPGPAREQMDLHQGKLAIAKGTPTTVNILPSLGTLSGTYGFAQLVNFSGGKRFADGNNLDKLLTQAVTDGASCYTISYRPSTPRTGKDQLHKIEIIMKDHSLKAASREGYYSGTSAPAPMLDAKGKFAPAAIMQIGTAARGGMIYTGIPVSITREDSTGRYLVSFKASVLPWKAAGNASESTSVAAVIVGFDTKGKQVSQQGQLAAVSLPLIENAGPESRTVTLALTAPKAEGTARLRFILRSDDGKVGTGNVFLVDKNSLHDPTLGLKR